MRKKIFTYNVDLSADCLRIYDFDDQSLLDADILIISPSLPVSLYEGNELERTDQISNWNSWSTQFYSEIVKFLETGKNIYVYLNQEEIIKYKRNFKELSISSYQVLGNIIDAIRIINKSGKQIIFNYNKALTYYWSKYSKLSMYEVYFEIIHSRLRYRYSDVIFTPCFSTKAPESYVGGILKISNSNVVLLPNLKWNEINHEELINHIIKIDEYLRGETEKNPLPEWVTNESFPLPGEDQIKNNINQLTDKIGGLENQKTNLFGELEGLATYRELLFENGKRLEYAIIQALRLMGFTANSFQDEESQFDVVFSSSEGSFIGEVEGKEKASIDVDKCGQLIRNIGEYIQKEPAGSTVKGVLFGNAYRFELPENRMKFFTEKCISTAISYNISLVNTTDLFWVSRYLLENPQNEDIKNQCRQAIMQGSGIVNLVDILPIVKNNIINSE